MNSTEGPVSGQARLGVTLLRVAVSSVFIIHGLTRTLNGTVGNFGEFLGQWGIPAGTLVAWLLTAAEMVGGLALTLGLGSRLLAAWFGVQILMGIVMVHGREGWFVVGAGRNGAEYSALIIACLVAVALTEPLGYSVRVRVRTAAPEES